MNIPADAKVIVERGNKTVYDCGDTIVKLFNDNKPAADVFNEALNLSRINETGIASPAIKEVSKVDGAWALSTEKIEGKTLAELMEENPEKRDEYLQLFVDLQIEINKYSNPMLQRQADKYARMINALTCVDATCRYNLLERLDGMQRKTSVCHGDLNPSNIIVSEDGTLSVCDWAHATQGCPEADVAMSYLLFALTDRELANDYMKLYCKTADMPMQIVRPWLSIVAGAELARKRGMNTEFLMSWIDVVDYQ